MLSGVLVLLLGVNAFAAGEKGIYDPTSANDSQFTVSVTGTTQSIMIDSVEKTVYLDAESVSVTYQGAVAAKQYLLLVTDQELTGGVVPNANNIQYINQDSPATAGSVTFSTVYPKSLTSGKTYYIYLSSDDGTLSSLTLAGTFKYYAAYILGDIDGNKRVQSTDAYYALLRSVKVATAFDDTIDIVGDVDRNGKVQATDAYYILQYSVQLITEWPTKT